jgi:hypothetical protein
MPHLTAEEAAVACGSVAPGDGLEAAEAGASAVCKAEAAVGWAVATCASTAAAAAAAASTLARGSLGPHGAASAARADAEAGDESTQEDKKAATKMTGARTASADGYPSLW